MFDRFKKNNIQKEITALKLKRGALIEKNNEIKTDIKKTINNTYISNKSGMGIACPYASPNFDIEFSDEPNEPFGWKKGTVRAIITLCIIETTCLMGLYIILGNTPLALKIQFYQWWLIIAGIVISSYFVTRMSAGMFNRRLF